MDAERKLRRQAKLWRDDKARAKRKFDRIEAMRTDKAHSDLKRMQNVTLHPHMSPGSFYKPKNARPS